MLQSSEDMHLPIQRATIFSDPSNSSFESMLIQLYPMNYLHSSNKHYTFEVVHILHIAS